MRDYAFECNDEDEAQNLPIVSIVFDSYKTTHPQENHRPKKFSPKGINYP